jgi:hypothetical protein
MGGAGYSLRRVGGRSRPLAMTVAVMSSTLHTLRRRCSMRSGVSHYLAHSEWNVPGLSVRW